MAVLTSWWYARRIKTEKVPVTVADLRNEVRELLKLGVVFLASNAMSQGAAYAVRILVMRNLGEMAVGHYQAAYSLAVQFASFVLSAMAFDFYPRVAAVAKNNEQANRMVNQQAEIGMLLAGPGALATLGLAPLVIWTFYSAKFANSVDILCWNCLGVIAQVASYPLGYLLIARNEPKLFFWSEVVKYTVQVGLAWLGIHYWGLTGAGIAYFASFAFYSAWIYFIMRNISGFRWSTETLRVGFLLTAMTGVVFGSRYVLSTVGAGVVAVVATIGAGIFSLRTIAGLLPLEQFPRRAQPIVKFFQAEQRQN
jgi:PST family polysaccharide transporter